MKNAIIITLLLKYIFSINALLIPKNYNGTRTIFLLNERYSALGGNSVINIREDYVNKILMQYKYKEINEGFQNSKTFLPSRNFLEVRDDIEKSPVFKIIKSMPKGAALHSHEFTLVSADWIFCNVTYRDHLYVCDNADNLTLHFYETLPDDCNWKLLSELRADPVSAADINTKIRRKLSIMPSNSTCPTSIMKKKLKEIIEFRSSILLYQPVYEDYIYQALEELFEDNIFYVELMTKLQGVYSLDSLQNYNAQDIMGIHKKIIQEFKITHMYFIGAKIIYTPVQLNDVDEINNQIQEALELNRIFSINFAGFALVDFENKPSALKKYINRILEINEEVNVFFYTGPTDWYGWDANENLLDAILLNSKRIDDGYGLMKHPKILQIIRRENTPIEVCPIADQILGIVNNLQNHPASFLIANNYPVIISNASPGLWGARGLSYDFYEAFMGLMSRNADIRALKQLALNSIIYSSMENTTIPKALWSQQWSQFLDNVILSN